MFNCLKETHSSAGRMWENHILRILEGGESQELSLRSLSQDTQSSTDHKLDIPFASSYEHLFR